jgi:amino acid adenylation domain-containing protein/non-ribosomal peptide synthase protein (TIGR01720 family)
MMRKDFLDRLSIAAHQNVKERDYWLARLSGGPVKGSFVYDGKRAAGKRVFAFEEFGLDRELFLKLMELGAGSDYTLHLILTAGLAVLLSRFTRSEDMVIGTPVYQPEREREFINTVLPLRVRLCGGMTFKELLLTVRQTVIEAVAHQNYPLEILANQLNMPFSEEDDCPLFDTALLLKNIQTDEHLRHLNLNMVFLFQREQECLEGTVAYHSLRWDKRAVKRIVGHLKRVLGSALSNIQLPIAAIDILSGVDKRQLLFDFDNTNAGYPEDRTIQALFEERVAGGEDRIAVEYEGEVVSYGELNRQANRLARVLRASQAGRDKVIGMILEPSLEMITVIMGILKAGGAYLPIEPRTPAKRILAMLADCRAAVLLGQTAGFTPEMLILNDIKDWLSRQPTANVEAVNDPADIAYIIYTSGTTGRPKGVMIEHRNVVRLMANDRHPFDFCPFDVWTMFHSCCFDFSVWEMYGALLYGGRLILVPRLLARNPGKYLTLLKKHGVTVLNQTPTAFYNLVNEELGCRERGLYLRYVIFGGEALKPARLKEWRDRYPGTRLINMYGITETTVHVTFKEIGEPEMEHDISNIGKPIPTLNTYVLDDHLHVSPIGIPGELCVGGAGLARGYLNRVEWTHAKFGPDPFRKGRRIYRSGDLARVVDNGRGQRELEYLGRIDLQVKIRGYRIEPAEIESQLLRHKNIREAAVVTRQDETASGQAYLCAYIAAAEPGDGLNLTELRGFLSQELPDYMIPARFILIDRLPLGASSKIDYRLLQDMDGLYLDSGAAYAAPANEIEEKLAAVWQSVLGREKIGTNENFFTIGGDSVKAIQIVSRMKKLGCRLEMKDMFQYPSIAQLAPRVTKTEGEAHSLITGAVPLTPFQRDFLEGLKMGGVDDDRGVVLWARESFDEAAVGAVFKKIMEHHDALRTTFGEKEGRLTQTHHGSDYPLLLKVTDLRGRKDAAGVVEAETTGMRADFNLSEGPLMKLTLFHLDEGDRLVIVLHRLIADIESWPILLEDFDRLYRQYKRKEGLTLPPKTDAFKPWCEHEQLRQYGEADGPGGEAAGIEWEISLFTLTDRETALLLTRSNEAFGTRSSELLLTALGLSLKACWGQSRLSIVLQRSGRQVMAAGTNLKRTVGCFTCSSSLILDFSFEADLSRQIKEVKESVRLGRGQRGSGGINVQFFEPLVIGWEPASFDRLVELPGKQRLYIAGGCEMAVTGRVLAQRLTLSISYDCRRYAAGDIDRLLDVCRAKLSRVIDHCCTRQGREVTPSDLTYKELSIEALAELTSLYPLLEDIYPLTPMQEGMFFHWVYDRTSTAYFGQVSFQLQGDLHVELVERSLNELFERHDILRTAFIQGADGQLLQVVLKERLIDFYYRDISGTGDKAAYLAGYRERDRQNVFDLSQEALMRFAVFKLAPSLYELVWSQHHILMDGWCTGLLIAEFFDIYRGFLENRQLPLTPRTPYRVYIEWLQRQDRQASQAYWRRYLTGYEELASLPGSKAFKLEGEEDRYRDEQFVLGLEAGLTAACGSLAGKNRVTLNTLIQAVWAIVLAKYNGRNDVVFGGVVAGRPAEIEGVESMIGLFINTVPVRIRFGHGLKFDALLQRVQQEALESEPHHYYPLVKIQAESPLRQHLLDHILVFENYPLAGQIEGKIECSAAADSRDMLNVANTETFEHTHYDFNIIVVPGERLHLLFKYNARLYEAGFIERTAGQVKRILNQVVERRDNDQLTVRELSLLSPAEKRQILIDFNDTARELPPDNWLLQPFERRVNREPHRVALTGSTGLVSGRELDNRANRLARFLRSRGLGLNTTAGIRCERSIEMVVAIFGVLKSGGAYLPIDPAYPEERLVFMLEDSSSRVLLTHAGGDRPKGSGFDGEVIDLEDDGIYRQGSGHVSLPVGGDDLAYVIYTSGSTGRPKGVMVEQRGVINILYCLEALYPLRQQDAYLLKTNYCFDVSVTEIFGWFFGKGRLVVLEVNMEREPGAMVGFIDRFGVTHINFVPSMLTAFLDALQEGARERLKSLKYIFVAGEAFTVPLANRLIDLNLPIRFENIFGPTEATIYSAAYSLPPLPPGRYLEVVPIGRSLHNITNYIVDDALNLQPVDIPAELCIGGVGLARGYLNRPELTAEKFVPAPFAGGERLYRTGDLACFLPDGNIDCLGRLDQQVKVRGFRVELAEIESHLLGYGDIKEAAVLSFERAGGSAAEDGGGDKYICAYIVADRTVDLPGLREFLARRLPDFMIPAYFKQLEGLPLTASGKIDRPALPEPGALSSADYVPPRDRLEKRLAEIWQELLGVERVGINDNFFELGGDSIKAIQVASRLQRSGLKLESRYIFLNPFIGELKKYVGRMDRAIDQGVVEGRAPLSPIQGWFFRHCRTDRHHFNQAVLLQRRAGFDEETIRQVFTKMVAHHDALRMVFSQEGGTIVQQNRGLLQGTEETLFGLDVVDLRQVADLKDLGSKIAEAANRVQRSLDPEEGPLVKLGLFRTGEGDLLLMVIHHLVIDGVSWRILLEDFTAGYRQVQQNQAIRLQAKTDSFLYWCRRLPEYAHGRGLSKEIDYWRGLDGIDCKKLAVDHEIGPAKKRYGNVESVPVTLSEEYTGKLLKEVNRAYRTDINDILMAALGLTVKAWANLEKVAVTFEGHGREDVVRDIDISRTIGWFTSLYPLVLDMADTADLAYTVKSVKETLRRVPNRGVGYGILRYLTDGVKGEEVRFRLEPEIVFNYLGQFGPADGRGRGPDEALFEMSGLGVGESISPRLEREHKLDVGGILVGGRLSVAFGYNKYEYDRPNIDRLARLFESNLVEVIDHCCRKPARELTPSDVGCPEMSIRGLEKIQAALGSGAEISWIYPLTAMQAGMLFHWLKDSASTASTVYHEQTVFFIEGEIDADLLARSFNILISRYDILRTAFIHEGLEDPVQVVLKERTARLAFEDISHLDSQRRGQYLEEIKRNNLQQGFDPAQDLLVRLFLVRVGPGACCLILDFFHIIMDGWCLPIIYRELIQIYQLLGQGKAPDLPPVNQYIEYIRWLESQDRRAGLRYWQAYLEGVEKPTVLPRCRTVDPVGGENRSAYEPAEYSFTLDGLQSEGLQRLAREIRVTVNTVLQTLWGILLQKYNDTDDVVWGTLVSGRPPEIEGIENMVGLFINTVPIRLRSEADQEVSSLLARVQQETALSRGYEYVPLAEIQAGSTLKRDLIDHIWAFENYPVPGELKQPGQSRQPAGFNIVNFQAFEQTNYDFCVIVSRDRHFRVRFNYNAAVYDRPFVEKVAANFSGIIGQVVANRRIKIAGIAAAHDLLAAKANLDREAYSDFGF